jgi:hypothetical protein
VTCFNWSFGDICYPWGKKPEPNELYIEYDDEVLSLEEDDKESRYPDGEDRAPNSPRWENRTLDKMLKRYGGRTWRKHCKRLFDPFRAADVQPVTPITQAQWKRLKQAYWLTESGRRPK